MKVYAWTNQHFFLYAVEMCAGIAGIKLELVIPDEEMKADKAFLAKKGHMNYPILETEEGEWLSETNAVCGYLLRKGGKASMLGETPFQQAKIDQWGYYCTTTLDDLWKRAILSCWGLWNDSSLWFRSLEGLAKELRFMEENFAKNGNMTGSKDYSLADILIFKVIALLFSFVVGKKQRAHLPAMTAWFEKMYRDPIITRVCGKFHMCEEPWTCFDSDAVINVGPAAAAEEEKGEEDEMDLFGDDDEDDDQDARMALKAKAHEAKLAKKKVVIAKSMILFEVKPLESETDLDALAQRIFKEITMDGLLWKEQYKKEPVAFGIFKLVMGVTVEDDKVSTDDIQEKIEAMDDMVQSVDIASFQKV